MPRTLQDVLDHAGELAEQVANYEPRPDDDRDPEPMRRLRDLVIDRADAERAIAETVADMRAAGYSWAIVGGVLGTTGQSARERYGKPVAP